MNRFLPLAIVAGFIATPLGAQPPGGMAPGGMAPGMGEPVGNGDAGPGGHRLALFLLA